MRLLFLAAHFCLYMISCSVGSVHFLKEPLNLTVSFGHSVLMPCVLEGTSVLPNWLIDGIPYTVAGLPTGLIMLSSKGLKIDESVLIDYRRFQCFVLISNGTQPRPTYVNIESSVGFLTVISKSKHTCQCINSMFPWKLNVIHMHFYINQRYHHNTAQTTLN